MTAARSLLLALSLSVLVAAPAAAFTDEEEKILERDCTGDYLRLCAAFDPDSPQLDQCFQQKMRELSPACRNSIQAITRGRKGRR